MNYQKFIEQLERVKLDFLNTCWENYGTTPENEKTLDIRLCDGFFILSMDGEELSFSQEFEIRPEGEILALHFFAEY